MTEQFRNLVEWVDVFFAYEEKPTEYTTEYAVTDLEEFGHILNEYPDTLGTVTPESYAAAVNYCIVNRWNNERR